MKNSDVLFISYFFDPSPLVGAKRISYWADQLGNVSGKNYNPTVITSSLHNHEEKDEKVKRISSFKNKPLLWTFKILPTLFKSIRGKSIVLITGSPFELFWLAIILKFFRKKVILDFRDPYSNNPIHNINFLKKKVKNLYEYIVCIFANRVITVNVESAKLIICNQKKIRIIENGFDERILGRIIKKDVVEKTISYSGKLSLGRDLNEFIEKMKSSSSIKDYKIVYTGPDFDKIRDKDMVINYGQVPYEKNLEIISRCEYTLLLFAGHPFESSTKVFDYIGLNKPIIVYSSTGVKHGAIADIMKKYTNCYYFGCENFDNNDIANNNYEFSRLFGLKQLINLLDEL